MFLSLVTLQPCATPSALFAFLKTKQGRIKRIYVFIQLSYTSKATSGQRLSAMEVWIGGNMPESDADKEHGDQVLLVSGCV